MNIITNFKESSMVTVIRSSIGVLPMSLNTWGSNVKHKIVTGCAEGKSSVTEKEVICMEQRREIWSRGERRRSGYFNYLIMLSIFI